MKTPRLNRRLVLQNRSRIADGSGGFTEVWTALGEMWAEVSTRAGRERSETEVPVSLVSYRIIVRAAPVGSLARPLPAQRFAEGPRHFVILAVAEYDADGRYLSCFADEEIVA